ncbi:MAG: hypothetical protein MJ240_11355 [Kiritimatiellae bacterium]|nr:hypothetical protein [Kiritimatiellia bacterium]
MRISLSVLLMGLMAASVRAAVPTAENLSLNGDWKFRLFAQEYSPAAEGCEKADFDDASWRTIDVPSSWELRGHGKPQYYDKISGESGFYRRLFAVPVAWPQTGRIFLRFDGVQFGATVWVNGRQAGDFTSSFNAHDLDVTGLVRRDADNLLAVRTHGHPFGAEFDTNDDWTLHGIFRDVTLLWRPELHVASWRLTTRLRGEDVEVTVKTTLSGAGDVALRLLAPDGTCVADGKGADARLLVKKAALWSAETPTLHRLEITAFDVAGRPAEVLRERVGLKEVTWNNRVLKVNGVPVKLRGVDHHDITPNNGRAVTAAEQRRDVEMIKAANCNFIRTSHYPPSRALLDACDELGIYVQDEVPFGFGDKYLPDPACAPILCERARLTLARDFNRASVIMWSVGNENPVTDATRAAARVVKALDPSRPWNFPQQPHYFRDHLKNYPCSDVGDLVNWHYPNLIVPKEQLQREYFAKFDRPYLSGEYAHAYGLDFGMLEWYWDELMWNDPAYAGGAVWMFQDQGILRKASDMAEAERANCVWPDPQHVWDSYGVYGTDGVVYADRTPQTDYFELRKVYAPVRVGEAHLAFTPGARNEWRLPLENRFDMRELKTAVSGVWRVLADRQVVASGALEMPTLAPHQKGTLSISAEIPAAAASVWRLELAFTDRNSGCALTERVLPLKVDVASALKGTAGASAFRFDANRLELVLLDGAGQEVFRGSPLLRTDRRDMIAKNLRTKPILKGADRVLKLASARVVASNAVSTIIEAAWGSGTNAVRGHLTFSAVAGGVKVAYGYAFPCRADLVETGLAFALPPDHTRFDWIGQGPYECYPRASMLSEFGLWTLASGDLYFPGNRQGVALAVASVPMGKGVALQPVSGTDVVFERQGTGTLIGHNAFVAGKGCKFLAPLQRRDTSAHETLEGEFLLLPLPAARGEGLRALFGEPTSVTPFAPFFKSYDT